MVNTPNLVVVDCETDDPDLREHRERLKTDPAYTERSRQLWSTLPRRAHSYTNAANSMGAYRITPAIAALRDWYDALDAGGEWGGIAVLAGPTGTGKTVAACWLAANRLVRIAQDIRFVTAQEFAHAPRSGKDTTVRRGLLEGAYDATILDDLGAEQVHRSNANAWIADLDQLVDAIYRSEGTAVITTNCTGAQFRKRYGARVFDRLRECGEWIPCEGPSLRGRERPSKVRNY